MEKELYLIYKDSMDDASEIKGVIVGNEEEADEWCEKYNSKCKYEYQEVYYQKLKILTDDDIDE